MTESCLNPDALQARALDGLQGVGDAGRPAGDLGPVAEAELPADLMSKILDPWTRRYLAGLGVGQGWRCLELGGGNGSITEWLCAAVGPSGA